MPENTFDSRFRPLPVAELLQGCHHFVIPSFQRGYRWERKQVTDLLDDIYSFSVGNQESYFLQPLVIRSAGSAWEVLDGQQRLTTMLLILNKFLSEDMTQRERLMFQDKIYDIKYKIRPSLSFDNPDPNKTIDGFYLAEAKATIDRWFYVKTQAQTDLSDMKKCLFFITERGKQVKFIWYEIDPACSDLNSINVFNRLNKGKISLTSSELIKALFVLDMAKRNGADDTAAGQMVMEWNEMERRFQDDSFWFFISNEDRSVQTRIDLLFDFMTRKSDEDDSDYSYRLFQNLFDHCHSAKGADTKLNEFWTKCQITDLGIAWRVIKSTFNSLIAWYEDSVFYHYIGFLINEGSTPLSIYNSLQKEKSDSGKAREWTRDDSERVLKALIRIKFKEKNTYLTRDGISRLEYTNSDMVRRVLLLFNVELCIRTGNQRFRFDAFKQEHWDIEHIDSQNDSVLQKAEERLQWLRGVIQILQMENKKDGEQLLKDCSDILAGYDGKRPEEISFSPDTYNKLYRRVNMYFSFDAAAGDKSIDTVNLDKKNKHSINNLTLLNCDINRSYQDAPFPYKRYCIIEEDKAGKHFIPIGTRNLFLKYYSSSKTTVSSLNLMRWNQADKDSYLDYLHTIVDPIIDPKN